MPSPASQIANAPYYRQMMRASGVLPGELQDPRSLAQFRFISRADLGKHAEEIVVPTSPGCAEIWSSGTSGQPLRVFRGESDEVRFWQLVARALHLSGNSFCVLFLCALPGGAEYASKKKIGNFSIHVQRVNIHTSKELARDLARQSFDLWTCSPAGWRWANSQGFSAPAVYSTALPWPHNLAMPRRHLHTYSASECGPMAALCRETANYHVFNDVYIEDAGGGNLAMTKLYPSAFPLVRYLTGDTGLLCEENCNCGFHGLTIRNLRGRKGWQWNGGF